MRNAVKLLGLALSAAAVLGAAACVEDKDEGSTTLAGIDVIPVGRIIEAGESVQLGVVARYTGAAPRSENITFDVAWSLEDPANDEPITETPCVEIAQGVATGLFKGAVNVVATYVKDGQELKGKALITVTPALVALEVSPTIAEVPYGFTQAFTATGRYADFSTVDLTAEVQWAVNRSEYASFAGAGVVLALDAGKDSDVVVSAVYRNHTDSATLRVNPAKLESFTIAIDHDKVPSNRKVAISVEDATWSNGAPPDGFALATFLTWTSDPLKTVVQDGMVGGVAPVDPTETSWADSITASYTQGESKVTSSNAVSVTFEKMTLTGVALSTATLEVMEGHSDYVAALGTYQDANHGTLDWTPDIADLMKWTVVDEDEDGAEAEIASADKGEIAGLSEGTVTVQASIDNPADAASPFTLEAAVDVTAHPAHLAFEIQGPANMTWPSSGEVTSLALIETFVGSEHTHDLTGNATWLVELAGATTPPMFAFELLKVSNGADKGTMTCLTPSSMYPHLQVTAWLDPSMLAEAEEQPMIDVYPND